MSVLVGARFDPSRFVVGVLVERTEGATTVSLLPLPCVALVLELRHRSGPKRLRRRVVRGYLP